MKKVLIVGSTSILGTSVGRLLSTQYQVFYAGKRETDYYLDLNSLDIKSTENLQFDIVIHAAADFGTPSEDDFHKTEMVNAIGTLTVCCVAKQVSTKHLIIISSISACYKPGEPYYNIYSLSKRHAEELAALYCDQAKIPLTILRSTQLYDAESKYKSHQSLFYTIIDQAEKGENITLYGNHDAKRNYLFVDDFCKILVRIIEKHIVGVFNCLSPTYHHLSEIAKIALFIFNRGGSITFLTDKPNIPDLPQIDDSSLYSKIGFTPTITLTEGIKKIKQVRSLV